MARHTHPPTVPKPCRVAQRRSTRGRSRGLGQEGQSGEADKNFRLLFGDVWLSHLRLCAPVFGCGRLCLVVAVSVRLGPFVVRCGRFCLFVRVCVWLSPCVGLSRRSGCGREALFTREKQESVKRRRPGKKAAKRGAESKTPAFFLDAKEQTCG